MALHAKEEELHSSERASMFSIGRDRSLPGNLGSFIGGGALELVVDRHFSFFHAL